MQNIFFFFETRLKPFIVRGFLNMKKHSGVFVNTLFID